MWQPRLPVLGRPLRCPWNVLLHGVCHRAAGSFLRVLAVSRVLNTETRGGCKAPAVQSFQPQTVYVCPSERCCLVSPFHRGEPAIPVSNRFLTAGKDSFLTQISKITVTDAIELAQICRRLYPWSTTTLISSMSSFKFPLGLHPPRCCCSRISLYP